MSAAFGEAPMARMRSGSCLAEHAEGRADQKAQQHEDNKQQRHSDEEGGLTVEIEFENAEDRIRRDAGKSIAASCP